MENNIGEITVVVIFLLLLTALLNPFGFLMPDSLTMMMSIVILIVFVVFGVYVWREQARDEREGIHRMLAGRVAFLVGTSVLLLGVIVQSVRHQLDPWLVVGLGVMVLTKMLALSYASAKR